MLPWCMLRSCTAPLPMTWQYGSSPTLCYALQKLDLSNNHFHGNIDALLSQTELLSDFSISNNKWGSLQCASAVQPCLMC